MYASFLKTDFPPQAQAGSEKGGGHFPSVIHGKKSPSFFVFEMCMASLAASICKKRFPSYFNVT